MQRNTLQVNRFHNKRKEISLLAYDSGINKTHSEFKGILFEEFNAINPDVQIKDDFGHGTAIAGIIAARGENIRGVLNKNFKLYDVKVLDENGQGKIENVVRGLNWSIEQNVDIINISFGFQKDYDELQSVINKATSKNIIVVAAAGNTLGTYVDYPAKYNNVLSITSINDKLKKDPFSASGKVDYSAPGVNIKSTNNSGDYSIFNGTSFVTAFATGSIACLLSKNNKDSIDLGELLQAHTLDLGVSGYDKEFGHGLIICN
jgi:minor extracellular protease Epr